MLSRILVSSRETRPILSRVSRDKNFRAIIAVFGSKYCYNVVIFYVIVEVKTTLWSAGCYVVREREARQHSALCMAKKRKEEQYIKFVYLTAVFFITYTLIASPASQIFWGHFCAAFISQKFFLLWGSYCMIKMPWSWDVPFAHKWTKSLS